MEKIIFTYNREYAEIDDSPIPAVIFSPCEDLEMGAGVVAHKFEKNTKCFKRTGERWLKVKSGINANIPDGAEGELLLYETIDSGKIWQASFDGREPSSSENEWVYKFSGTQV